MYDKYLDEASSNAIGDFLANLGLAAYNKS